MKFFYSKMEARLLHYDHKRTHKRTSQESITTEYCVAIQQPRLMQIRPKNVSARPLTRHQHFHETNKEKLHRLLIQHISNVRTFLFPHLRFSIEGLLALLTLIRLTPKICDESVGPVAMEAMGPFCYSISNICPVEAMIPKDNLVGDESWKINQILQAKWEE